MHDILPEIKLPSAIRLCDGTKELASLSKESIESLAGIALRNGIGLVSAIEQCISTESFFNGLENEGFRIVVEKDDQFSRVERI